MVSSRPGCRRRCGCGDPDARVEDGRRFGVGEHWIEIDLADVRFGRHQLPFGDDDLRQRVPGDGGTTAIAVEQCSTPQFSEHNPRRLKVERYEPQRDIVDQLDKRAPEASYDGWTKGRIAAGADDELAPRRDHGLNQEPSPLGDLHHQLGCAAHLVGIVQAESHPSPIALVEWPERLQHDGEAQTERRLSGTRGGPCHRLRRRDDPVMGQ